MTAAEQTYFAAHSDLNQALIDFTQPVGVSGDGVVRRLLQEPSGRGGPGARHPSAAGGSALVVSLPKSPKHHDGPATVLEYEHGSHW